MVNIFFVSLVTGFNFECFCSSYTFSSNYSYFDIFPANESIYVDNNCLNCIMQELCVPDLFLGLFDSARGGDMLSAISCRILKGSVKKNVYIYLFIWQRQIDVVTSTNVQQSKTDLINILWVNLIMSEYIGIHRFWYSRNSNTLIYFQATSTWRCIAVFIYFP